MHLSDLRLINFKNYTDYEIALTPAINCIVGPNGSGKTNLLDAIHYLSLTKSAFNTVDTQNINHDCNFFTLIGKINHNGKKRELFCSQKKGSKKIFKIDNNEYEKLSEHVGVIPSVLTAPNDNEIIREGSEIRRKFFDNVLSQTDHQYLLDLIAYNHNLKQRNGLLKFFSDNLTLDLDLLQPYNKLLFDLGLKISQKRRQFIESYSPVFLKNYLSISNNKETTAITYASQLEAEDAWKDLEDSLDRDLALQRTMIGIHRDKWEFTIGGKALKKFGSQGQQKTFIIALKIAQFDFLKEIKGFAPILLLDDIFDKLDDTRIESLMQMIADGHFSQIFLTDARPERTKSILSSLHLEANMISITNGNIQSERPK